MLSADAPFPSPALALRGFVDDLGERVVTRTGDGEAFEALRLTARLADHPACGPALSAGVESLRGFAHPAFHPAPAIEWLPRAGNRPVIVSRYRPGRRVVDLLADAQATGRQIPTNATLFILRELVSAVRALHEHGVFHGAIGPERVLVTPDLQVLVLEHALGSMLAAVAGDADEVPRSCGIAVSGREGRAAFSPVNDQFQIGLVGLGLLVGRRIGADEYPFNLAPLLDSATEVDLVGRCSPLDPLLREWFARVLHVSRNGPFPDLEAAEGDLGQVLSDEGGHVAAPVGLEVEPEALVPMLPAASRPRTPTTEVVAPRVPPLTLAPPPVARFTRAGDHDGEGVAATGAEGDLQGLDAECAAGALAEAARGLEATESRQRAKLPKPTILLPEIEGIAPDPVAAGQSLLHLATSLEGGGRKQGQAHTLPDATPEPVEVRGLMGRLRLGQWPLHLLIVGATVGIVLLLGMLGGGYYLVVGRRPATLVIESAPAGVAVLRDGQAAGRTPLTLSLPRGGHLFELRGTHSSQTLSVFVRAGEQRRERVELPEAGTPGTLMVLSEPPGVTVRVDDQVRGEAPLTLSLVPGRHVVSAGNEVATITREIVMEIGGRIDLALPVSGWIDIVSPVPVQTTVSGRPVPPGVSRIASATGRFRVECVNNGLGLRDVQDVVVEAGKAVQVVVAGTSGVLDITADVADAAVWIDGKPIGRVPLTSVALALGSHQVRFVHPKRGEVSYQIDVGMGAGRLHGEFGTAPPAAPGYRRR